MHHEPARREPALAAVRVWSRRLAPWGIGLLGCLVTLAGWLTLLRQEEKAVEARFQLDAGERELVLRERLEDAARALHLVQSFYDVVGEVRRDQFSSFVVPLLELHPDIQGVGWNALVRDSERDAFERQTREAGAIGFQITERAEQGRMVPAARREEYVAVQFVEPYEGNEAALGFDTASEPRRRQAIEVARETGELAISSGVILVQEDRSQTGVLGFLPVFGQARAEPVAQEAALRGFVVAVFRLGSLVENALAGFEPVSIDLYITDESEVEGSQGLFPSRAADVELLWAEASAGRISRASPFVFGGRQWRFLFVPTETYLASQRSTTPRVVLLTGLLLSVVVTAYLLLVAGHASRVDRLVAERTGELRASNAALEEEVAQRLKTEKKLSVYGDRLEDRVRERTAELESTTDTLRQAVRHRDAAEEALVENEERLQLTLQAVADGAWDWNIETGEVLFSDSWLESLGYQRSEIEPGAGFWQSIVHPDDRAATSEALERHLKGLTPQYECENRLRTNAGEYRWNLDRGQVVTRDDAGKPLRMVGTDTDITQRKEAERRQLKAEQQLQQTQRLESLGVLAGGIAHDFNNILVPILGGTDLALSELPPDSPARGHLELVTSAAGRAAELIRQIHAYSGQESLARERIALVSLIEGLRQLLSSSVSKKAELKFDFAEDLPEIEGDASQLRQVVVNLIVNASDALDGEPGEIRVAAFPVTVDDGTKLDEFAGTKLEPGRHLCIEVADNGSGMDEEVLGKVFDPFFTTKNRGQGLGLAATLGIVRSHRGALQVRSTAGHGTTVRVVLPGIAPVEESAGTQDEVNTQAWRGAGIALVVDDDPSVRRVAERMLAAHGMQVLTAIDGQDGVDVFAKNQDTIAVTLLDMSMPRMDGAEAFRAIRRIRPDARILLSSGYSEGDSAGLLAGDERAAFVQKPYRMDELRGKLQAVLGR